MQALGRCVVGETCKTPSILEAQEEERVILAGQYYLVSFRCLVLRRLAAIATENFAVSLSTPIQRD